jgi:hypothetical protein
MYNVGKECVMGKIYLKKVMGEPYACYGCYFWRNDSDCPRPANGGKGLLCGDFYIFKKTTKLTAEKLLKSGWRISCLKK